MEIRYPIAAQVKFDIGLDPHVPKTQNVYFHKLRHAAREDSPKIFYFSPDCKMTADPSFSSLQDFFWASAREVHLSFEVDLFPGTTCHASDMCASKRGAGKSSKFALGLLPPLGGRINGLTGILNHSL